MKRLLPLIVLLFIGGAVLAVELTLKQQIQQNVDELDQLAEGLPGGHKQAMIDKLAALRLLVDQLPDEPVPDPDPDPDPEPDPDVIDNPPAAATTQPGLWSDPATFGHVRPGPDTHLTITHDVEVDAGTAGRVDLYARLKWIDSGTLDLHGSLVAWSGGIVDGTTGRLSFHVPDDRLFVGNTQPGPLEDEPDFHPNDIGLWGMMGSDTLLRAPAVTTKVRAVAKAVDPVPLDFGCSSVLAISEGTATLSEAPVGWQVGDVLAFGGERGQYKTVTLDSIDGTAITYTERDDGLPASYEASCFLFEGEQQWAPVVANLSRRFVIDAPLVKPGDTHHRAHIAIGHHAHFHVQNVELRNLGPRGKLGRYPFHCHHVHGAHGDDISGCSIWQDLPFNNDSSHNPNRAIVIHQTQGVTVENNVVFYSQGHAIYTEEHSEYDNVFRGNVVIGATGETEIPSNDTSTSHWSRPHAFWIRAGNEIENNIAIGCGVGINVSPPRGPDGNIILGGKGIVRGMECVGSTALGSWAMVPADWHDLLTLNNTQPGYRGANTHQIHAQFFNPRCFLDGTFPVNDGRGGPTSIQIYNNPDPAPVYGGIIANHIAFRPYRAGSYIECHGTRLRVGSVAREPSERWNLVLKDCNVTLDSVTNATAPVFDPTHGDFPVNLTSLVNCNGTIRGEAITGHTADYVPSWMPNEGPFAGTDTETDRQLSELLPLSGLIYAPLAERTQPGAFVRLDGSEATFTFNIPTNQHRDYWTMLLDYYRGYVHGLPPGVWVIRAQQVSGGAWETRRFTVVSGEMQTWGSGELIGE